MVNAEESMDKIRREEDVSINIYWNIEIKIEIWN